MSAVRIGGEVADDIVALGRLQLRGELCGIDLVAADAFDCGIPAVKGVGVRVVSRSGRGVAVILGHGVERYVLVLFKQRTVPVVPRNGIGVERCCKRRSVGRFAGHGGQRIDHGLAVGAPAREVEEISSDRFLGRLLAGIDGNRTVFDLCALQYMIFKLISEEGDHVLSEGLSKLRGVGDIFGNLRQRIDYILAVGAPARERIGILLGLILGRRHAVKDRHRAVGNIVICFKLRAEFIGPSDSISSGGLSVDRDIGHVAGNLRQRIDHGLAVSAPARKGIAVLSGRLLGRCLAAIRRSCAFGNVCVGFEDRSVIILPCDGIGLGSFLGPLGPVIRETDRLEAVTGFVGVFHIGSVHPCEFIAFLRPRGSRNGIAVVRLDEFIMLFIITVDKVDAHSVGMPDVACFVIAVRHTHRLDIVALGIVLTGIGLLLASLSLLIGVIIEGNQLDISRRN